MDDSLVPLGTKNGIELSILSRKERTLGRIIEQSDDPGLIEGVKIASLQLHPDDRGLFVELARLGNSLASELLPVGDRKIQVTFSLTYPGVIKAIHYHAQQTDLWVPLSGMIQVFLYDLRRNSRTFGHINTLFVGRYRPWEILIPPGVGHGYKALGAEPAQLLYFTDRYYNPADEFRLVYNHPAIAYDWETRHK